MAWISMGDLYVLFERDYIMLLISSQRPLNDLQYGKWKRLDFYSRTTWTQRVSYLT